MPLVKIVTDDIFNLHTEAIVNPVNCVGVMGKGLALSFARVYSEILPPYIEACDNGTLLPGTVQILTTVRRPSIWSSPRAWVSEFPFIHIINFPTKNHWKDPSCLEWIRNGLEDMANKIALLDIKSVAIPPLGCGNGGLKWEDIQPLITDRAAVMDANVYITRPCEVPIGDIYNGP